MTLPTPTNEEAVVFLMLELTKTGRLRKVYDGVDIDEVEQEGIKRMFNKGLTTLNRKIELLKIAGRLEFVDSVGIMHEECVYHVILTRDETLQLKKDILNMATKKLSNKELILNSLKDGNALKPKELARRIKTTEGVIYTTLSRMANEGLVVKNADGAYSVPATVSTALPKVQLKLKLDRNNDLAGEIEAAQIDEDAKQEQYSKSAATGPVQATEVLRAELAVYKEELTKAYAVIEYLENRLDEQVAELFYYREVRSLDDDENQAE